MAEARRQTLRPLFTDIELIAPLLLEGYAVLTPNRRLSRALRVAEHTWRQGRDHQAWDTRTIMPIAQYWLQCHSQAVTRGQLAPATVIEPAAELLLWEQIIDGDEQPFSLLSPARAAAHCQQAMQTLLQWRVDLASPTIRQVFCLSDDGRAFLGWAEQLLGELKAQDLLLPEQALAGLLSMPDSLPEPLALLCIDELPPLYHALCEHAPGWKHIASPDRRGDCLPIRSFPDRRAELRAAAHWCREQHDKDSTGRYAVVLSDMRSDRDRLEYFLRQEFDCLTRNYDSLPVNFATGFTLDRTPLVSDALTLLDCSRESVEVDKLVAALQSAFVKLPAIPGAQLEHAVSELRDLASERLPQRLLRQVLGDSIDVDSDFPWHRLRKLESEQALRRRRRMPSEWLEIIDSILKDWGWPLGRTLDSLEFQQLQHWQRALESFAGLDAICGHLDFEQCSRRLRGWLAAQQFQPQTEDRALQVLGPLETTGLYFDSVWLVGLSSDVLPASARPNPYIPLSLQRTLRTPHADAAWEWDWAQRRWDHWRAGARRLQASYVYQRDGVDVLASPILPVGTAQAEEDVPSVNPRWQAQAADLSAFAVELAPIALTPDENAAQGTGAFALEQQANCPFSALAAVRLQAHPGTEPSAGLLPSERGSLLHRALFVLGGEFSDRDTLQNADHLTRTAAIERAIADARRALPRNRRQLLGPALLSLEDQRLKGVLLKWLELESRRASKYRIVARESAHTMNLEGLTLSVRVDRIDAVAADERVVIDYKSGEPDSLQRWFEERPARPQLPLYSLLDPPASGIAYAVLKAGKMAFKGVAQQRFEEGIEDAETRLAKLVSERGLDGPELNQGNEDAMQWLRHYWQIDLAALAREFIEGRAVVEPKPGACRYCQRHALCRVDDVAT